MASNPIPILKSQIKQIIDTIEWEGQTFAARALAGNQHVFTHPLVDFALDPLVEILYRSTASRAIDTMTNDNIHQFTVRIFYEIDPTNFDEGVDILEELGFLIVDTVKDYMSGVPGCKQLMPADGAEVRQYGDNMLTKDVILSAVTESGRQRLVL